MQPSSSVSLLLASRLRGAGVVCAVIAAGLGVVALFGWALDLEVLTWMWPGSPPMKANAALCFLLAGASLVGYRRSAPGSAIRRAAAACAALVLVVGVVTLAEYALGRNLGIDRLLFSDRVRVAAPYPGRPAANAALGLVLLGAALLLWDVRIGRYWPSNALASVGGTLGLLALMGYATGAGSLIDLAARQRIAVSSAAALALLSLGLLLARPERGAMRNLASADQGGVVLRRLLPVAIALPISLATLTLTGQKLGLYRTAVGGWVFASTVTFVFAGVAWLIAGAARRADAERSRVEVMLRAVSETASEAIVAADQTGAITYANPALEKMFGHKATRLIGQPLALLVAERDRDRLRCRFAALLASDDWASGGEISEVSGLHRDGREFAIEISSGIWRAQGEPVVAEIIRDVSARHRHEKKLRGLLESAPDAIVIVDAAGEIVLVNARAETLFGYAREELVGRPVELLVPERPRHARHALHDVFVADPRSRRVAVDADPYARRKDGSEFPVEITLNPIQTDDGLLVSSAIRDISERRQAEQATARLAAIVESSEDAIIGMTLEGTITSWNPAAKRIYGYTTEDTLGRHIAMLCPSAEQQNVLTEILARVANGGGVDHFETTRRRHDGRLIDVSLTVSPIHDPHGRLTGASTVARDITVRRQAEQAMARLAAIVESCPDAIIGLTREGTITSWNGGAERLYGHLAQEAVGQPVSILSPPERAGERDHINAALAGNTVKFDTEGVRRDGSLIEVGVTISPIRNSASAIIGISCLAQDMTERKRSERELERLAAAAEHGTDAVISIDLQGCVCHWNPGAERLYGWSASEAVGRTLDQLTAVTDEPRDAVARMLAGEPSYQYETQCRRKDDTIIDVLLTVSPWQVEGRVVGATGVAIDVTDRRRAENDLRDSEERLRTIFEGAPIGVALVDSREPWCLLQANQALGEIWGIEPTGLIGRGALTLIDESDREAAQAELERLLAGNAHRIAIETQAAGHSLWASVNGSVVAGSDGRPQHLIVQVQDITDRKRLEHQLRIYAERDPLTGLFNRRRLSDELARQVAENTRYGTPATLLVSDLDNFKLVNDTLGHKAGDEQIKGVARVIGELVRETDVLARLGGDEFAVLLPHTDIEQAQVVAESLRCAVHDLETVVNQHKLRTTLSVGIAPLGDGISAEESLAAADRAMYEAKRHGRDRIATSSHAPADAAMSKQFGWLERLRGALAEDRFELHAQPITDLCSGEVSTRELLLRMRDEDGQMLMPGAFIYTAERFGLIGQIDRWVVSDAIRILAADHSDTSYSVNLSGVSVGDPELLTIIERAITDAGVDPGRLIFEFTETAVISDLGVSREFTRGLSRIGCASALDDFGSGFGSFTYLKYLPVDYVKIDGEFVRNLPGSEDDRVLVKAIVDVARGLHKQTIAEWVGSEEVLDLLRDYGVDYAQGAHLGMPQPLAPVA